MCTEVYGMKKHCTCIKSNNTMAWRQTEDKVECKGSSKKLFEDVLCRFTVAPSGSQAEGCGVRTAEMQLGVRFEFSRLCLSPSAMREGGKGSGHTSRLV